MMDLSVLLGELAGYFAIVIIFLIFLEFYKLFTYGGAAHTPEEKVKLKRKEKKALSNLTEDDQIEIKTEEEMLRQLRLLLGVATKYKNKKAALQQVSFSARINVLIQKVTILLKYEKLEEEDDKVLKRLRGTGSMKDLLKKEEDLTQMLEKVLIAAKSLFDSGVVANMDQIPAYLEKAIEIIEHLLKINGEEEILEKAEEAEEAAEDAEAKKLSADELAKLGDTGHILGYLRNFALDIAKKVDHPDNQVTMDDMREANKDIQKIVPMLKKLREDSKLVLEDEKKLKKIIPDKELEDEFDEEKNLINLLLKLIIRLNKAIRDNHHGDTAHYVEKIINLTNVLIHINEKAIKEVKKDETVESG